MRLDARLQLQASASVIEFSGNWGFSTQEK